MIEELPPGMLLEGAPVDKPRELAKKLILQLLMTTELKRSGIIGQLEGNGLKARTIDTALGDLYRSGRVVKSPYQYGFYMSRHNINHSMESEHSHAG